MKSRSVAARTTHSPLVCACATTFRARSARIVVIQQLHARRRQLQFTHRAGPALIEKPPVVVEQDDHATLATPERRFDGLCRSPRRCRSTLKAIHEHQDALTLLNGRRLRLIETN